MPANYQFLADVTIPDDMEITAGEAFIKTWRVKNIGDVAWGEGFTLRFDKGVAMTHQTSVPLPACAPGEEVEISLDLIAPTEPGTHWGDWFFYDAGGTRFGEVIYLRIVCVGVVTPQPNAVWVADLTIPDDTVIGLGTTFEKSWRVRNTGNMAWGEGFTLVHTDGEAMTDTTEIPLPPANIGATADITITFTAPTTAGMAFSDWRFRDANGNIFGEIVYVRINAKQVGEAGFNDSTGLRDVTVPDDTPMQRGTSFVKRWLVRNSGTTTWDENFTLRFINGTAMTGTTSVPLPHAAPGDEVEVSVDLTAPSEVGVQYCDWKMHDPNGNPFGDILFARIKVQPAEGETSAGTGDTTEETPHPTNPYANVPLQAPAPFFSQRDPRWAGQQLGNHSTLTIQQWGCMMTCIAMFIAYKGYGITPGQLNTLLRQRGIYYQGYLTPWDAAAQVYSSIQFSGREQRGQALLQKIDAYLQRGIPVLANVDITPQNAYNSNMDQHWVLIVSKYGDDYLINDPAEMQEGVISLRDKYGYAGRPVYEAIQQAIFYS